MMELITESSNSSLATYLLCPKKYWWTWVEGRAPKQNDYAFQPAFGTAFHEAMESWYSKEGWGNLTQAMNIFEQSFAPYEGMCKAGNRTIQRGKLVLINYAQQFPIASEPFDVEGLEIAFSISIGSGYLYRGTCDGLIRWKLGSGELMTLEHKTTASKGYLSLDPSNQATGYMHAVSEILGEPVLATLYNTVFHEKPTKSSDKITFSRDTTHRTPLQLEEWRREVIQVMDNINQSVINDVWPKNTASCGAYFRACEFKDLCSSKSATFVANMLETCFTQREPSPTEKALDKARKEGTEQHNINLNKEGE